MTTASYLDVGWKVRDVPLAALHPWPGNPRRITERRWRDLLRSLRDDPDFMRARPLVVTPAGVVMAGNMRLRAMVELGWPSAPCIVIEEAGAAARAIRDNVGYGEWVEDELAEALWNIANAQDLAVPDLAAATGIEEDYVMRLIGSEATTVPDPMSPGDPAFTERVCPACGHRWRDL